MITIRKASRDDAEDFVKLMLISAPYFPFLFGDKIVSTLHYLFHHESNLFSFKHVYFAEVNGEKAGMILGYNWRSKKMENLKTGFLLFKKIPALALFKFLTLMKFNATIGRIGEEEYYISNLATYPQYRGKGIGKGLILETEQEAKMTGAKKIVLDVERENLTAINFYKKLNYEIIKEFNIPLQRDKILHFYRMVKQI